MFSYLFRHIILDTLYFPLWWYTRGIKKVLTWAKSSLSDMERTLALRIWLRSMFKPMFQDYTRSGRIISFFMRFVLLLFKCAAFMVWALFVCGIILAWALLPVFIFWLIAQIIGIRL